MLNLNCFGEDMSIKRQRELKKKEKAILKDNSIQANSNNVIVLDLPADQIIIDDELTNKALLRIEDELIYTDLDETIEIYTAYPNKKFFKQCLDREIKREIIGLREDEFERWKLALWLILSSLVFIVAASFVDIIILNEFLFIFGWVLAWGAIETAIFVIPKIRYKRRLFVHLFSADVKKEW